jgi:nucleotide-binding universal stress UspA family protein
MSPVKNSSLKKILLGVDGSSHAYEAIRLLKDLPLSTESTIIVLGVLSPLAAPEHHIMEHVLEQSANLLSQTPFQVEPVLRLGYPAEILGEYAQMTQPDLIVLGARGLRATLGILLGGVAQQVVEYACCPVLVVRAPYQGLKRVLMVTDGSSHSRAAGDYLGRFPLPTGVRLEIMNVVPPSLIPNRIALSWPLAQPDVMLLPQHAIEELAAQEARLRDEGQAVLDNAVAQFKAYGLHATPILKEGDAATEILAYSRANKVDLIVAGSRGLSQVQAWLLGSVSRKLVHYADCSILITKQKQTEPG